MVIGIKQTNQLTDKKDKKIMPWYTTADARRDAMKIIENNDNEHSEYYWKNKAMRFQKLATRYKNLAEDLREIMPGQPGCGDFSREQRTLADYDKLMKP